MWQRGIVTSALAALAAQAVLSLAQAFTFTIGSPVASQDSRSKLAAFVFRIEGCAEPAKAQVGGTAEGLVAGARKSAALKITAMSTPGVYAVYPSWAPDGTESGDWVVNLTGTCAAASAGALIPMGPNGFLRASSKFLPRPATASEIDAALSALSAGRHK